MLIILGQCEAGRWEWIASEAVDTEVGRIPNPERRRRVQLLISHANRSVAVGEREMERAQELESGGVAAYDALHLACAEGVGADVLLATDDQLLRSSMALAEQLRVRVENPLVWLGEAR